MSPTRHVKRIGGYIIREQDHGSESLTHYGTVVIFFHEEMNTRETNLADGMTSFF